DLIPLAAPPAISARPHGCAALRQSVADRLPRGVASLLLAAVLQLFAFDFPLPSSAHRLFVVVAQLPPMPSSLLPRSGSLVAGCDQRGEPLPPRGCVA